MRKYLAINLLALYFNIFSQDKKVVYYNESLKEIMEVDFIKQKNNQSNQDIYFENNSLITGLLARRKNYG
ncbi:hypothetical protein, partial [Daejeonella sp.]|uniref:hypothetical protein n=1 Tax=Daejeonella sp. TaxID=2805397 RepID=UPI0030C32FAC